MTAKEIIHSMVRARYRERFCLPNYTPAKWWECDVFEITRAGYMREYEVKISRADFFADAHKSREVRESVRWVPADPPKFVGHQRRVYDSEKKHDLLAAGNECGPSAFFYVTPAGLIQQHELPVWAGLLEVRTDDRYPGQIFERVVTDAPKLHQTKLSDKVRSHAVSTCYWRMHQALGKNRKQPTESPPTT